MANGFGFLGGAGEPGFNLGAQEVIGQFPEIPEFTPAAVPTAGAGTVAAGVPAAAPTIGSRLRGALADPNILNLMANLGSSISQGQPFGQAAGAATQQLLGNRALQESTAAQSQRQAEMQKALINAAFGRQGFRGNLVGPPEDATTANKITISPRGTNIEFPTVGAAQPFQDVTDRSLEAQPVQGPQPLPEVAPVSAAAPGRLGVAPEAPRFPFV